MKFRYFLFWMCLLAALFYALAAIYLIHNGISAWKSLAMGLNMTFCAMLQARSIGRG